MFDLCYCMKGGITYTELYKIPIRDIIDLYQRLVKVKDEENRQLRKQQQESRRR